MDTVNKIAAVGIVFFFVVLAGFIGYRVDQTTMALLGGTVIGLIVAIPATALVVWLGVRQREQPYTIGQSGTPIYGTPPAHMQTAQVPPQVTNHTTHNTTHHHYNIVVQVAPGATQRDVIDAVLTTLPAGATAFDARQAVLEGRVRVVPMLPSAQ